MRYKEVLCLTVVLACLSSITIDGQTNSLASRVIEALRANEPGWRYVNAIESSHIRLVPSERTILVGILRKNNGPTKEDVPLWIYEVENPVEGAKWLDSVRTKQVAPGWQVSTYGLGDEAYLLTYENGKRFEIQFRSRNIVCKIAGDDPIMVKAFAKETFDQVSE